MVELKDCPDCAAAKVSATHPHFRGSCQGCAARMASDTSEAKAAAASGKQSPAYMRMLARFGVEHADVKQWRQGVKK